MELNSILTFRLKDGTELTDDNALIKTVEDDRIAVECAKAYKVMPADMDEATVMLMYGNSSVIMFSLNKMVAVPSRQKENNHYKVTYNFRAPIDDFVILPNGKKLSTPCVTYHKLRNIVKGKRSAKTAEKISA